MSAPPPPELTALRRQIDAIDTDLIRLVAKRNEVIARVAEYKRAHGLPLRDPSRETAMLSTRRDDAAALGADPDVVESLFRSILLFSRDFQAARGAVTRTDLSRKHVALIGGGGAMGGVLAKLFGELGHEVSIADVDTPLTPEDAARQADVVVVSVPITSTVDVIRRIGPLVRPESLLMDVTSIKGPMIAEMLAHSSGSVVGTHPMFGPRFRSLHGQRIVVCKGRGDAWYQWLVDNLLARGLLVTESDADAHDKAMSLVQVLTHFQTQVVGLTLARLGVPPPSTLPFTSALFLIELYLVGRHFAQSPELFGAIEMMNPETPRVLDAFARAANDVGQWVRNHDRPAFERMFSEVRGFLGSFTSEATVQSTFLIDRLVERAIG